jgi:YD repeat-containing protein
LSIGYEYYADGRRKKLIYPDATFITYEYNAKGWLTAIRDGGTNTIVSYEYDAAGRRTRRELENNTFTTYEYDDANQLLAIVHGRAGSPSQPLASYEYRYDAAGNRTNILEILGIATNTTAYTADADNQLTSATASRQGITVTGYVQPGPASNKWYASVARASGQQSAARMGHLPSPVFL